MLAEAAGVVVIVDAVPLWSAAWRLSHDVKDGCNVLVLVSNRYGAESVRQLAGQMLSLTQDSEAAATMGVIEFRHGKDLESVNQWVRVAEQNGYRKAETLLQLKLILSDFLDEYDKEAIAEEILSRNDLPATITIHALVQTAYLLLERQLWDDAEAIADRILGIEEHSDARLIKWVALSARGDPVRADEHLKKARGKLPDAVFSVLAARGLLILGQTENAMEQLYEGNRAVFRLHESRSPLGQMLRSEQFKSFCRQKENR
jgi:tetratricopeptide (TPR) repeat protein